MYVVGSGSRIVVDEIPLSSGAVSREGTLGMVFDIFMDDDR